MKHFLYTLDLSAPITLEVDGETVTFKEVFYCGYTQREPNARLYKHWYDAKNPSMKKQLVNIVRGHEGLKNRVLLEAERLGIEVKITVHHEKDQWESLNEQIFIYEMENTYRLTNAITGGVWQPKVKLSNGEIVDTVPDSQVNDAQYRKEIQERKRNGFYKPEPRKPRKQTVIKQKPVAYSTWMSIREEIFRFWILKHNLNKSNDVFPKPHTEDYDEWIEESVELWEKHNPGIEKDNWIPFVTSL